MDDLAPGVNACIRAASGDDGDRPVGDFRESCLEASLQCAHTVLRLPAREGRAAILDA